jgi:hypothetical protein
MLAQVRMDAHTDTCTGKDTAPRTGTGVLKVYRAAEMRGFLHTLSLSGMDSGQHSWQ